MSLVYKILIVVAFVLGFTAAAAIGVLLNTYIDNPIVRRVARTEGAVEERKEWEELLRIAKVQQELRLAEMQEKINEADKALQASRVNDRLRAQAFEAAIKEQNDENQSSGVDLSVCDLPDRVWDALNK